MTPRSFATRTFQDLIFGRRSTGRAGALFCSDDMEWARGHSSATVLRAVGPEPWCAAHVQPSRRPTDGRYGTNKPRPAEPLRSSKCGISLPPNNFHGVDPIHGVIWGFDRGRTTRFVEAIGNHAGLWGPGGLGWEVWMKRYVKFPRFTYFQQVGLDCVGDG